jgi:hypothetical protein
MSYIYRFYFCIFLKYIIQHCFICRTSYFAVSENAEIRARIFKLLRSARIDSKDSVPPAYVAWRGPVRQPYSYSVPNPHRLFKNSSTGLLWLWHWQSDALTTQIDVVMYLSNTLLGVEPYASLSRLSIFVPLPHFYPKPKHAIAPLLLGEAKREKTFCQKSSRMRVGLENFRIRG